MGGGELLYLQNISAVTLMYNNINEFNMHGYKFRWDRQHMQLSKRYAELGQHPKKLRNEKVLRYNKSPTCMMATRDVTMKCLDV